MAEFTTRAQVEVDLTNDRYALCVMVMEAMRADDKAKALRAFSKWMDGDYASEQIAVLRDFLDWCRRNNFGLPHAEFRALGAIEAMLRNEQPPLVCWNVKANYSTADPPGAFLSVQRLGSVAGVQVCRTPNGDPIAVADVYFKTPIMSDARSVAESIYGDWWRKERAAGRL